MPARSRYPLDALLRRRKELQDDKARALAERMRESAAASQHRRRAEAAEQEHRDAVEQTEQSECARIDDGAANVQDLLAMQAWEIAQQAQAEVLRQQVERAAEAARQASAKEGQARGALATAQAEADVVDQDRQRFTEALRKQEQARSDEDAEETHAARAFLARRKRGE